MTADNRAALTALQAAGTDLAAAAGDRKPITFRRHAQSSRSIYQTKTAKKEKGLIQAEGTD